MQHRLAAYSLFELVVTMALIAVVFGLGVPSFGNIVARHQLRTEAEALFHAFYRARKESIARRRVVTLCPSVDGQRCTGDMDWSGGWMMFVNRSRRQESQRADDEERLLVHQPRPHVRIVANRAAFSLRSTDLRATNGTLRVCDANDRATARAVVVSYTGRPRVSLTDSRGRPVTCAD